MPNKRKCKQCGTYGYDYIRVPVGSFCSHSCLTTFAQAKAARDREKALKREAKQADKERIAKKKNKRSTREKAAKEACHAYIRYRDRNETCICCGEPLGDNYHAGHFLPSGMNTKLRYNENNIHAQRLQCNYFKGGDSGDYERNLRLKIGDKKVNWLLSNKGARGIGFTIDELKIIERYYKQKLKILKQAYAQ